MLFATLIMSARDWIIPASILAGITIVISLSGYSKLRGNSGTRAICLLLKVIGLLALAFCLLEPLWTGNRVRPGANFFALLADNSQGMQIHDRGEQRSRGELLHAALTDEKATWQGKLNDFFQVRSYFFDSRLQSTKDFSELQFDGRASSIGASLKSIGERFQGQPLAGILLFSDGNATDIKDNSFSTEGLPPIYPVIMGKDDPIKDIGLRNVTVAQTAFEDAPVTIQADASAFGYSGAAVTARLLAMESSPISTTNSSAPKKIVAQETKTAGKDGDLLSFRFQIRPEKAGLSFYTVEIRAQEELDAKTPQPSSEATLANNQSAVVVDRGKGPYRILYVTGRPNWEYKFLHRALEEDDQVEMVGLIRVAKREPKFAFRGRAGETSNPLFRGFDNKGEETERYDQPVLVRLNVSDTDPNELRSGFPKTAEELYRYQAIILDDLEAEFFTHDQMALIQKYVSERGGGFLMLGGAESLREGKFERTPIGDLLPIYLDRASTLPAPDKLRLSLTREGWLQPWARLRKTEAEERARLDAMPDFQIMNQIREPKPGASTIATVQDAKGTLYPAIVAQRFGRGRSAAMMIGDFWRWGFRDEAQHKDMNKAWRQLIRWLIADVPKQFDFQVEPQPADPNQAVLLQVRVRDKKFQPLENASVNVRIQSFGPESAVRTNLISIPAEASASEPGLYQVTYIPRETGAYKADATISDSAGGDLGKVENGWTSDPAAEEFRSLKPNRPLLEALAKRTGGEVVELNQLDKFADNLPHKKAPILEAWSFPVWHQPAVIAFALFCFIAEWGLRRRKGWA